MIPLYTPIQIEQQPAMLVDDLVLMPEADGAPPTLMSIASDQTRLPLFVERSQVDALAEAHEELPLYGLWQTLIASGRIPDKPGRYQVHTNHQPHPGRYLVQDADGAYSGWMRDDVFLDLFPFDELTQEVVELNCDPTTLRLPSEPIHTLSHRLHATARQRRQTLITLGVVALTSTLLGLATNQALHQRHLDQLDQMTQLHQRMGQVRQDLHQLSAEGRINPIDQSQQLDRLLILSSDPQSITLPNTSLLEAHELSATVHAPHPSIPPTVPGLEVQHITRQPDGSIQFTW